MPLRLRTFFRLLRKQASAPARRVGRRVKSSAFAHPSRSLLIAAVLFASLAVGYNLLHSPAAPADTTQLPTGPAVTYVGTWDLLDLTRHLEAGDVLAISRFNDTASDLETPISRGAVTSALAAQTRDGQWIKLDLNQTPAETVLALRALGYGRLLSEQALTSIPTAPTVLGPNGFQQPDQLANFLIFMTLLLVGGAVITYVIRNKPGGPMGAAGQVRGRAGSHGHFSVILPPVEGAEEDATAAERLSNLPLLADIAGVDEAKLELTEIIDFLKDPTPFALLGAEIPRGLMLYGPPGTGKTSLAKAIAREANVAFFHTSGAEFVEMYVGVGAKRIRELFTEARKLGRAVVFVDEFDALGKSRGGPNRHDESEQTLTQLLKEMDGFDTTDGVVVIGATNRLDILDQALLRPGRFGRKVNVPNPDKAGREAILAVHSANKPLSAAVDLAAVARRTFGFSGAMLKDILNEAAILAARKKALVIEPADIAAGWLKVAMGVSRTRSMEERERSIIAVHEAGHAVCGRVHGNRRRIEKISLKAHGDALGFTASSSEDDSLPSESGLRARLIALMGGRAAEAILFHENTGGASDDFKNAHNLAEHMVRRLGMGRDPADTGPAGISGRGVLSFLVEREGHTLPASVVEAQSRAIAALLDESYASALETLSTEQDRLELVAAYLYEAEEIDGDEFDALMDGSLLPASTSAWRVDPARPRSPEEIAAVLAGHRAPVGAVAQPSLPAVSKPLPPRLVTPPLAPPVVLAPTPAMAKKGLREALTRKRPTLRGIIGGRMRRRALAYLQAWEDRNKEAAQ